VIATGLGAGKFRPQPVSETDSLEAPSFLSDLELKRAAKAVTLNA
jgi:hypothetical protein